MAQEAFRIGCERLGTAAEGLYAEKETAEVAFKQETALLAEKQRKIDEAEALRPVVLPDGPVGDHLDEPGFPRAPGNETDALAVFLVLEIHAFKNDPS